MLLGMEADKGGNLLSMSTSVSSSKQNEIIIASIRFTVC